ncbi:helix-turn-helix transcriptional regulator [Pseudomonas sp. PB120]|uniref:helix-turn-helix domain-containing protein n=1 Tax=Pseudomonas sp. PB120 TaxID=2494700 RepID=UPI0012FE6EDE|nr:helix-turn-helix domain-containing protein [Pseudomonas sp. PB120]MVV49594.1 helix-turn-helix transcriptional regulator [Pseudomonas sp. PB120]
MPAHQPRDSLSGTAPEGDGNSSPAQLTAKETQALIWFFKGKTSWEIARIQNCSESTVNFHFTNIRRKFAVSSRSAALLKAIESGAISVGEAGVRGAHEPD